MWNLVLTVKKEWILGIFHNKVLRGVLDLRNWKRQDKEKYGVRDMAGEMRKIQHFTRKTWRFWSRRANNISRGLTKRETIEWNGFNWFRMGSKGGFLLILRWTIRINEKRVFLDQQSNYWLLKTHPTPLS